MQVIINGEPRRAPEKMSLAQAVALLTSAPTGVAAALNGDVVRRAAWDSTSLADGDVVEVLTAVQGGLCGRSAADRGRDVQLPAHHGHWRRAQPGRT